MMSTQEMVTTAVVVVAVLIYLFHDLKTDDDASD